jgi:alkylhydroperoxidase/carboxymuconolactone decarboxylase family protein YurZ
MADHQGSEKDMLARGDSMRRTVLGDEFVERSNKNADEFTMTWRRFATEASWGRIWGRPGLDLKTRSLCTISALVALGDARELRTHLRGALRLGITPDELAEVFIQVGGYAGSIRAGSAFDIAQAILKEQAESNAGASARD